MTELVWLLGALMALAVGLWLVLGMRSGTAQSVPASSALERRKFNAEAGREQLRLLQQQLERGEVEPADYELARAQLEAALLKDLDSSEAKAWQQKPWGVLPLLSLPILITTLSVGAFWLSSGAQHFNNEPQQAQQQQTLEQMVAKLAAKLEKEPDNLEGWIMLGRSYGIMQSYQQAADAFAQANRLTNQQEPDILVAQAESLGLAQGQNLAGEPLSLVEQALTLNPNHVRGLWYALVAASAAEDRAAQADYLSRLETIPDLPPQLAQILREDFGAKVPKSFSADPGLALQVAISLSDEAQGALPTSGTLFVFAKASNGPPMPLAVAKQNLPQAWPLRVELNDSMAMTQGMRLSDFDAWTIVARLSQSGQATAQSGDWEGRLEVTSPVEQEIRLTIDRQIP